MKWPRGRYNGKRIIGLVVKVRFDVLWWGFHLPNRWGTCLSFGPFHIWVERAFEQ
jgi:hypothetical protein